MTITINNQEYDNVKFGFKAMVMYERITGKTFIPDGLESILVAMHCALMASDKEFTKDYDEFCDMLDETPSALTDFADGIIATTNKRTDIIKPTVQEVKEGETLSKND